MSRGRDPQMMCAEHGPRFLAALGPHMPTLSFTRGVWDDLIWWDAWGATEGPEDRVWKIWCAIRHTRRVLAEVLPGRATPDAVTFLISTCTAASRHKEVTVKLIATFPSEPGKVWVDYANID